MSSISKKKFGNISAQIAFHRVAFKGVFIQNSEAYLIGNGLSPRSLTIKMTSFRLTSWNTACKIMSRYKVNLLIAVSYRLLSIFSIFLFFITDLNFFIVEGTEISYMPPVTTHA